MRSPGRKHGHKRPCLVYGAVTWSFGFWKTNFCGGARGDARTVRGAIGSRCGEAVSPIILWNLVGSTEVSEPSQTCFSPALTHRRAQEWVHCLLFASVNHLLDGLHTLRVHMRTGSSDISIWKETLKIQDLHVFCFHSYYLFFFFCTAFFRSLLHCAPSLTLQPDGSGM